MVFTTQHKMAVENSIKQTNRFKDFYNKYFPRDEYTYRLRMPFVSLILSILSIGFVSNHIYRFYFHENSMLFFGYIFVAFGVGCELQYGLKTKDFTQFTPWLLFKFLEVLLGIVALLLTILDRRYYVWDEICYEIIVIGLNIVLTRSMFKKAKQYEKSANPEKLSLQDINLQG